VQNATNQVLRKINLNRKMLRSA